MKAAFFTLGCKVNQYETQEMTEALRRYGFLIVDEKEEADVYIINSCSVTAESDRKTRQAVRHFRKQNRDAVVVLTGCMPQANKEVPRLLPEADIIMGNRNNSSLIQNIHTFLERRERIVDLLDHKKGEVFSGTRISAFDGHTRAFVKIQDGCDRFCSYCIIPYARGRSRSKPLCEIKQEVAALAQNGYAEVVFVGINLSAYGRDIGLGICDAVAAAAEVKGIQRVRLGSLEPDHITDGVLQALRSIEKFCPHFHLSLQSGSNAVLGRMNRHYTAEEYQALAQKIRAVFADASVTTDIIAGFPGETEEEFAQTLAFAKALRFDKAHIFPFSVRPGTRAAQMGGQLGKAAKAERCARLSAVCEEIRAEIFSAQIGKTLSVLVESAKENNTTGYTKNYTPVTLRNTVLPAGQTAFVRVTGADAEGCYGETEAAGQE
ncbi:MAG: tRNA (N(6)-L-threonylcarbamoyladenosine(37)-C(2))-methylthiotransferase MtaB [Oscillospiraceae bacterium]|nr:tRNA (N(6)-L-threonylcarbamoyladenosine(37)-C(2))-methylthiotransferase MtaB [Oscillospiraceae bacterium]